ncbi:hypothetical protein COO60DRAFT_1538002 [Scenedesmus sp. NREL 46B-D3]|nr:hypothetical protein COO60DRAFT_1538002 [Scenedesmus sp. NREL 46B-D3]
MLHALARPPAGTTSYVVVATFSAACACAGFWGRCASFSPTATFVHLLQNFCPQTLVFHLLTCRGVLCWFNAYVLRATSFRQVAAGGGCTGPAMLPLTGAVIGCCAAANQAEALYSCCGMAQQRAGGKHLSHMLRMWIARLSPFSLAQ